MSRFSKTLELVVKHWPIADQENDPLLIALATQFVLADTSEDEIQEICSMISDLSDRSFGRGLEAGHLLNILD